MIRTYVRYNVMSGLRSALEEWTGEDLADRSVDDLAEDLAELELVAGLIEAERARRLHLFRAKKGPDIHGYPSATAFLAHRCRIATGRARRLVATAETAAACPTVSRAWAAGDISADQARRLLEAAETAGEVFASAEETLVDIVVPLDADDTRRAVGYWLHTVVEPRIEDSRRGVSMSQTFNGMGRIDGWLTPLAYQALYTAFDTLTAPPAPDDPRTPRQRRHDALEDLARNYLENTDTPTVGGERPHINIVCDLQALAGVAGGRHETEDGDIIDIPTLRALACDSAVSRIVLGSDTEIIDVGRRTRTIPAALRRAVIARDRHCTHPGCRRRARWCDVHHDQHWADGGPTNAENCRLLCRYHHTLLHRREAAARQDTYPTQVTPLQRGPPPVVL